MSPFDKLKWTPQNKPAELPMNQSALDPEKVQEVIVPLQKPTP